MNDNSGERIATAPIATEKVVHERKIFFLDLKENHPGRFLKITEDVGGHRDTIMLPAPVFKEFWEALERVDRIRDQTLIGSLSLTAQIT